MPFFIIHYETRVLIVSLLISTMRTSLIQPQKKNQLCTEASPCWALGSEDWRGDSRQRKQLCKGLGAGMASMP